MPVMNLGLLRKQVRETIADRQLTYDQRVLALARLAENALPYPAIPREAKKLMASGVICDLAEGSAPYRPRYILPDYGRYLAGGSAFLEVPAPEDLDEALNALAIIYRHVPSVTGLPVYLGDLDQLLEPFASGTSDQELERKVGLFLRLVDRMCPDGFVHAVLGPAETRTGHALLATERRLGQVAPNWTLKYDSETTPDSLLLDAIQTCLVVGKPHFVNHRAVQSQLGPGYSVASCYNTLPLGGGSYTLARLNIRHLVQEALAAGRSVETILTHDLPHAAQAMLAVMAARIKFIVEESGFFESSFLAKEGLIARERFTAMFGLVGLAEGVNLLQGCPASTATNDGRRYGHSPEALTLASAILSRLESATRTTRLPYCEVSSGHALLHAQAGISDDVAVTPGARIPSGDEPDLLSHLNWAARLQSFFPSGVSDPMQFDWTARDNPQAVADILKGAFHRGLREFTFTLKGGEFVRVTGYLIRRSDLSLLSAGQASRYDTTALAKDPMINQGVDSRAVRSVDGASAEAGR